MISFPIEAWFEGRASLQSESNCFSLPVGLGGNGAFGWKFGKFEEIIQNEISLGGSPTIKVTLICEKLFVHYIEYFYKTKGK